MVRREDSTGTDANIDITDAVKIQNYNTELNTPDDRTIIDHNHRLIEMKISDKLSPRELMENVYKYSQLISISQLENSEEGLKTTVEEEMYL